MAQSQGAAYYKNHQRALYADLVLDQDLSSITEGLSAQAQLGYDTWSNVYEDHSKTYRYSYYEVPTNGAVIADGQAKISCSYWVQIQTWVLVLTTTLGFAVVYGMQRSITIELLQRSTMYMDS